MKKSFLCIAATAFLLLSCSKTKQGNLLEIPVDIHQDNPIHLSEIAEEIRAIELELTDESVIGTMGLRKIIISENEVFIATLNKILVFNKTGKFIRSIGSQGQGPKEYTHIHNLAFDEKSKRLFISSANRKIISYDLNGNFLKEKSFPDLIINDINYVNKGLFLLVDNTVSDSKRVSSHSAIWRLNDDFRVVDSCTIRDLSLEGFSGNTMHWSNDFILKGNESAYVYYGNFFFELKMDNSAEKILHDTLYRFGNNQLIPELRLDFKNDGKFITPYNIYRSSRYIFAVYRNNNYKGFFCFFCYDTKTGKGYNTKAQDGNGYTDDINQIEKLRIRPFNLNTEMFYYLHTNMKPGDSDEPNPTLYIGKLKK